MSDDRHVEEVAEATAWVREQYGEALDRLGRDDYRLADPDCVAESSQRNAGRFGDVLRRLGEA